MFLQLIIQDNQRIYDKNEDLLNNQGKIHS
jgi:hypothetical protein